MIEDFDAQTCQKAAGKQQALFLDGHSSHYTPELLEYAKDNKITIPGYPPHCTHALQGLDVVCFAQMKQAWTEAVTDFKDVMGHGVNKNDFVGVFGTVFVKAFIPETIKSAFKATGIYPYNLDVITEEQMKLSEVTSTNPDTLLPLEQPSPINALAAVWPSPKKRQINPATPIRQGISSQDCNIDPALYLLSEMAQTMTQPLAKTSGKLGIRLSH